MYDYMNGLITDVRPEAVFIKEGVEGALNLRLYDYK